MLHQPVLLNEVVDFLAIKANGVYVDCTAGHGGHSLAIAKHLNQAGTLVLIDQDQNSLALAQKRFAFFSGRLILIHGNFIALKTLLHQHQIRKVDGFLYDLGFSAAQIYDAERGFSYHLNGPLDMRMNQAQKLSASTIVNEYSLKQLTNLFQTFGEEKAAFTTAKAICRARQMAPIRFTHQLVKIIKNSLSQKRLLQPQHPARLIFQALRIAVNNELNALEISLPQTQIFQKSGTRIVIITYHSLEDRLVKNFFSSLKTVKILTRKPHLVSREEVARNFQARSAKLRVVEYV